MTAMSTHTGPALSEAIALLRALADTLESSLGPRVGQPGLDYLALTHADWNLVAEQEQGRTRDAQGANSVRDRARAYAALAVMWSLRGSSGQALAEIERSLLLDSDDASAARGRRLACGISELSDGDAAVAYTALAALVKEPVQEDLAGVAAAVWLAEAAIRTGQRRAARYLIAVLANQVAVGGESASEVELALAILDSEDEGPGPLDSVLQRVGGASPMHMARAEFALGRRLRRDRRISEARTVLQRATDRFVAIGAAAWAELARGEGAATAAHRRSGEDRVQLTARELEVAHLAADGLTNREIGQRLFISPRTVGHHLASIFPKVGASTRAQLARRLDTLCLSPYDIAESRAS